MGRRLENLCRKSTVHGIRELFMSSKLWQKCIWLLIIISCISACIYMVGTQAMVWSADIPKIIVYSVPVDADSMEQTLLRLQRWNWIDANRLTEYNISEEQLLMALSMLNVSVPIRRRRLDVDYSARSKLSLNQKMHEMQVDRDLIGFFSKLDIRPGRFVTNILAENDTDTLFSMAHYGDVAFYGFNVSEGQIDDQQQYVNYAFGIHLQDFQRNVSDSMKVLNRWIPDARLDYVMVVPLHGSELIMDVGNRYMIIHQIRTFHALRSCRMDHDRDLYYDTDFCEYKCELAVNVSMNINSCYEDDMLASTMVWPQCSAGFLTPNYDVLVEFELPTFRHLTPSEERNRLRLMDDCRSTCLPKCYEYNYITNILVLPGIFDYDVILQLMFVLQATVLEETPAYTWFNLIGDVGGLIGLWLGASIMSFIQLIHLLCVDERQRKVS